MLLTEVLLKKALAQEKFGCLFPLKIISTERPERGCNSFYFLVFLFPNTLTHFDLKSTQSHLTLLLSPGYLVYGPIEHAFNFD